MENASVQTRQNADGKQRVQIHETYLAMRTMLDDQITSDGLEREKVVGCVRRIVGERVEHEPELKAIFQSMTPPARCSAPRGSRSASRARTGSE